MQNDPIMNSRFKFGYWGTTKMLDSVLCSDLKAHALSLRPARDETETRMGSLGLSVLAERLYFQLRFDEIRLNVE